MRRAYKGETERPRPTTGGATEHQGRVLLVLTHLSTRSRIRLLALYQGTTLVVPQRSEQSWAFSPCLLPLQWLKCLRENPKSETAGTCCSSSAASNLKGSVTLSFVIPTRAEGFAVLRTSRGNAEYYPQTELSSRHSVRADPFPAKKVLGHVLVKRNRFGRGLRLALPDHLMPDGPSNPQFESLEIFLVGRTRYLNSCGRCPAASEGFIRTAHAK
jgi:hypothetical protein